MPSRWLILTSVACGTFMATLDSSIVNVALPSITQWFHTGLSHSRWVIISYLFSITGLLLFFGKLADTIGRKIVFNCGFLIFTLGSILCGASNGISNLIIARGVQGLGASMLMANGPAIITAAFPSNERGRALGILAMFVSAGLAVGPSLGGILIKLFGWQSIFFVNVPFGIAGAILVARFVPSDSAAYKTVSTSGVSELLTSDEVQKRSHDLPLWLRIQTAVNRLRYFDWLGAILWMVIQLGYSMVIDKENVLGISGPLQKILSAGALGLFFLFLVWEVSIEDPVLNLSLFKSRVFRNGNLAAFFVIIGMSSVVLLMPFYLQNVRGFSSITVGFFMTAIPITMFIAAPLAGRFADFYGSRALTITGTACMSLALLALGTDWSGGLIGLTTNQSLSIIIAHLSLIGIGFGIFQSPNSKAVMSDVQHDSLGMASAMLATVRNLGLVTGTALSSMLLMNFYAQISSVRVAASAVNFVYALQQTFTLIGLVCAAAIPVSIFLKADEKKRSANHD